MPKHRARAAVIAVAIALPATLGLTAVATAAAGAQSQPASAAGAQSQPASAAGHPAASHQYEALPHSPQLEHMLAGQAGRMLASRAEAGAAPPAGASAVQGVDVSSAQHSATVGINWTQVAQSQAGVKFAFVKVAEGNYYVNPYAAGDLAGASAAGLYVAPYDFAIPNVSGAALQADYALDHSGLAAGGQALPMILDIEYDPYVSSDHTNECYGLTTAQMVSWISAWIAEVVRRTGQHPALYSTADWWAQCTGSSSAFGADPLWIAYLGTSQPTLPAGWTSWTYWQYTSAGSVSGISGTVDLSYLSATALQVLDPPARSDATGTSVSLQAGALTPQTVSYRATSLPAGLSVNSATGQITGTLPATAGAFGVQVTVTPAVGSAVTQSFTWDVHGAVSLRRPASQAGQVGTPVALQVTAADGLAGCTLRFSATGLPPGLTMSSCGRITGWPRTGGHYQVHLTVRDAAATLATTAFGWSIASARNVGPAGLVRLNRSRCLDSGASGSVVAGTCAGTRAAKWTIDADGTLRFNGRCLSQAPGSGGAVSIAPCSRGSVRWQSGGGTGTLPSGLINVTSGRCLTDTSGRSGARVDAAACSGGTAQRWLLPAGPVSSGVPGYCVSDYHAHGPVTQQVSVRWCSHSASQTWTVQPGGQVQIGRYCLSLAGGAAVAGRHVVLSSCGRAASQNWQLYNGPIGVWLVNSAAGLCLSDPGDRARSGTGLVLGYCQLADPGITWRVS